MGMAGLFAVITERCDAQSAAAAELTLVRGGAGTSAIYEAYPEARC
jgi:hypothetical protein